MSNSDNVSSHSSDKVDTRPDEADIVESKQREVVIDLAGEDGLESDESSPPSVELNDETPKIKPRAYQIEMLEESLKHNIIVAADTGSGKTHIAVLRMLHELERIPPHQFIWFLTPTVSLCSQQFEYIKSQISAVQVKCLKGDDGVDRWTHQGHWDAVLKNVKIVVSTFQILLDALSNGLVRMDSLALIVFDEAHNCVGKHPGAKIMRTSYHNRKSKGLYVPQILALTASPVMRSDPLSLNEIEKTMDAICRTPTKHRAELRLQVNLPVLSQVYFQSLPPEESIGASTRPMRSLGEAFRSLKFEDDPYYLELKKQNTDKSIRQLRKLEISRRTWSQDQMRTIHATSLEIYREMGAYAVDWYISQVITKFTKMVDGNDNYLGVWDMSSAEKKYLANALRQVDIALPTDKSLAEMRLSDKVSKLIEALMQESPSTFSGIVFVQTRAEVAVMAHILSNNPRTRDRFRIETFVGTSAHTYRARNVGELIDLGSQKQTLKRFRDGIVNLVIATSVLEEGIDVPACNVVVCFQKPSNLKSFVQRRGRARHQESKLILLFDPMVDKVKEWQQLEMDMKRLYEDEMRALQEVLVLEDNEDHDNREFRVESTGAFLDLDNAVARLYHFCATLPAKEYVDTRPGVYLL